MNALYTLVRLAEDTLYTVVRLAEDNLLTFYLMSPVQHNHRRQAVLSQFIWTTLRCLITTWLMFQPLINRCNLLPRDVLT